jgi:Uma2 family endonuclease
MAETPHRSGTYEDLLALPDHVVGELIAGQIIVTPRPSPRHANASSSIGGELYGPYFRGRGGPGGWWILDGPELHLGDDVLVPDIAGWRRERMGTLPETAYFPLAPDWVCEVLSKSTQVHDRTLKLEVYAREGVRHCWFVSPTIMLMEVFRLHEGHWLLVAARGPFGKVRAEPFEEVEFDLKDLWGGPPLPEQD